ncbi:MAG TPA: hypothetical protein VF328_10450 [Mycobacterium sp.]
MVKVLGSLVRGPMEPHIGGFAAELLRRGYTQSSAGQHVCFLAHLDRWMSAEGIGLGELSGPVIDRYLEQRRAAGYVEYRSLKALWPLLDYLGRLVFSQSRSPIRRGRWRSCSAATTTTWSASGV